MTLKEIGGRRALAGFQRKAGGIWRPETVLSLHRSVQEVSKEREHQTERREATDYTVGSCSASRWCHLRSAE